MSFYFLAPLRTISSCHLRLAKNKSWRRQRLLVHTNTLRIYLGYGFEVGERGNMLSMGQKQLISFVRALVQEPALLILDEATSSIDTETERIIQHAVENLIKNQTSIVIAHRLSTIQNADKIMVLQKGVIQEFGTWDDLVTQNGRFAAMVKAQS